MVRLSRVLEPVAKILGRGTRRAEHNIADSAKTHGAHPDVPHVDTHPHADLDHVAHQPKPQIVEVPVHPDVLPARMRAAATAGVIGYGGYEGVQRLNSTADAVVQLPGKALDAAERAAAATGAAALAAAEKAAAVAAHAAEGPEAAYQAMLAQLHELEAGAKRVTGSGSLSTAIAVVSVTGSAYMALQFYRAYKS